MTGLKLRPPLEPPASLGRMADGFDDLFTHSLCLVKLELVRDARTTIRELALVGTFWAFGLVGYLLACVALAIVLAPLIGPGWAFLAVAAGNLVAGAIGVALSAPRLRARSRHALEATRAGARETARELRELRRPARPARPEPGRTRIAPATGKHDEPRRIAGGAPESAAAAGRARAEDGKAG